MVSTWRWRRRQPANLWLYGGLSLVFHGAIILTLHWAHPPLEIPDPEKPPPIEIVDAPKVEIDETPPPDTPNRAARNTVEQGTMRPDAPMNLETTQRSAPSAAAQPTQDVQDEKASQPEEPKPQPTPIAQAEPETLTKPSPEPVPSPVAQPQPTPSPVAQPEPKPEPQPVAQPEPKPQPSPIARTLPPRPLLPLPPKPAQVPIPQPEASPSPVPQATQPAPPAVTRPQPAPAISRPNPQPPVNTSPAPANPTPPQVAAAPPKPKGNASLLGGTLSKDARQANLDQEANTTRNAPGPTQLAARQEVDLGPYLSNLRRRVQQNWNPNTPDQRRQAVIGFTISRSGQISNMRVLQTSGSPQTDAETILAIQRAAPFGALPEQFPHNQLEIEFTFNIYVNNSVIQTPRSWYGF